MWKTLSPRQRRVLIGLGLTNAILLVTIGALALAPASEASPIATPHLPDTTIACRTTAAQALADHRVAGTVALRADGSIDFTLSGDDPADAWDAFAASAELPAQGCGPYDPIRVDVADPSLTPGLRLIVEARWIDVQAWAQGRIDDETLSQRTARSTYTQPGSIPH
ncbi:MAG TPA: hypothetical protein VIK33_10700 [Anaerolineae bacterium]